jgi:peptidoglycan/LPS O-acetylase OafA/YrhL
MTAELVARLAQENDDKAARRPKEPVKYPWIDVLRGIAILGVIAIHASEYVQGLWPPVAFLLAFGEMGVQLFFVVSAITLCLSTAKRAEPHPWLSFYIRRYFRIAPLYYLGIAFYALFSIPFNHLHGQGLHVDAAYNLPNIAANVFLAHGFYAPANNSVVPGGWSIGTEIGFYAIFPILFYASLHLGKWRAAVVALIIALCGTTELVIGRLTGHWPGNTNFEYYNLLNQMPVFLIGILAYYGLKSAAGRLLPATILGTLSLITAGGLWRSGAPLAYFFIPILCACAFSALALLLSQFRVPFPKLLVNIGKRSFSIYILHFAFLHLVIWGRNTLHAHLPPVVDWLLLFLFTLLLTDIAARVTERQIERRGIHIGHKVVAAVQGYPRQGR